MLAAQQNFGGAFQDDGEQSSAGAPFATTPFVDLAPPSVSSSNNWSDEALLHDLLMNGSQSAMGHADLSDLSDFSAAASMSAATTSNPLGSESGGSPLSLRDFIFRPAPQNDLPGSPFDFHASLDGPKDFGMSAMGGTADPTLMMGGGMDPSLLGNEYSTFTFAQPMSPKSQIPAHQQQQFNPMMIDDSAQKAVVQAKPEAKKRRASEMPKAAATKVQEIAPTANKRFKLEGQSNHSKVTPIMEAGSNSTAKAAIERLKAKRQAESNLNQAAAATAATSQEASSSNSSISGGEQGSSVGTKKSKQVAHNAIERRYRTNINDRITALRLAVPALRELRPKKTTARKKGKGASAIDPDDLVDGVTAATKLNKATILGKATEYIKYLKGREVRLRSENAGLRELVCSLDGGEELLELWENEMEKFVAAGEAAAKQRDDEELAKAQAAGSGNAMDEDDDDGDDEEDDDSGSANNKDSPASSNGSRYMMGMFMGATFLGSGAEFMSDSNATGGVTTPVPAAGRVIGVSHQLLRRAAVVPSQDPHHLDEVPTHHLALELVRYISLALCVLFILWPIISFLLPRRFRMRARRSNKVRSTRAPISIPVDPARSREMLTKLARRNPDSSEAATAMRTFVSAPKHRVSVLFGVAREGLNFVSQKVFGMRRYAEQGRSVQETAVWLRLLEVETALGAHATRSTAARTHTLLRIRNLQMSGLLGADSPTSSARVHATLALALARLTPLATEMAEQSWENARRVLLLEEQRREDIENELGEEVGKTEPRTAEWMHAVLRVSLADALALCPAQDVVASAFEPASRPSTAAPFDAIASSYALVLRAVHTSPLLSIADAVTSRALGNVWAQLFASVVRATCAVPTSSLDAGLDGAQEPLLPSGETTARMFLARAEALPTRLALDVITDPVARAEITRTIARIVAQAPPGTPSAALAKTTFGAWALMIGNGAVAARVVGNLVSPGRREQASATENDASEGQSEEEDQVDDAQSRTSEFHIPAVKTSSAAHAFCTFLLGPAPLASYGPAPAPSSALDALAAATLGWLAYVRTLSLGRTLSQPSEAHSARQRAVLRASLRDEALNLRMLLAQARTELVLPPSLSTERLREEAQRELEEQELRNAEGGEGTTILSPSNAAPAPVPASVSTESATSEEASVEAAGVVAAEEAPVTAASASTDSDLASPSSSLALVASSAPAPTSIATTAQDLETSRDVLVDVLACLGARAARGKDPWKGFGDSDGEADSDSGVEGLR